MAVVTGTLADVSLAPIPGLLLRFFAADLAATQAGTMLVPAPVDVFPDSVGAFSVDLVSTEALLPASARWRVQVLWPVANPHDAGSGYVGGDFPTWHLLVPSGGGRLVDLIDGVGIGQGLIYFGTTAPEPDWGYEWGIDTSASPPVLYRLP